MDPFVAELWSKFCVFFKENLNDEKTITGLGTDLEPVSDDELCGDAEIDTGSSKKISKICFAVLS